MNIQGRDIVLGIVAAGAIVLMALRIDTVVGGILIAIVATYTGFQIKEIRKK